MRFVFWCKSWWLVKDDIVGAETLYFLALLWLEHSAQLLKMRENFLPLHNNYLCRYLQRDLYPHCYIILTVCVCMCDQLYMYVCVFIAEAGLTVCVCLCFESRSWIECSQIYVAQNGHEIQDCYQQVTEASTPGRRDRLMMCVDFPVPFLGQLSYYFLPAVNAHKSILLKMVMRFRIATNNSRRSFHSWKKGSMDDVLIPIESYHMHDPSGTHIKHEPEFQQM
ncbi:hypothetical protein MTR67_025010 [Solanum verrucosum]|uniref:APO domain-containing protein n=1 Tax=Solanum verrucosum TaxID=315347 RepID=A0AAF0QZF4_SOLVR|nr:hypothetical protein MTR67_025010 [Solanum verrucosum]